MYKSKRLALVRCPTRSVADSWIAKLLALSHSCNLLSKELEMNQTCLLRIIFKVARFPSQQEIPLLCLRHWDVTSMIIIILLMKFRSELLQIFPTTRHYVLLESSYLPEKPLMNPQIDSQCFVS